MASQGVEEPSTLAFWIAFLTTVVLLVVALITGFTGRRRLHLFVGPAVMVALAVAIVLTEQLASRYDFPADALRLHLIFAKAGAYLAVPVIVTGIALVWRPTFRGWHRAMVFLWLVSVLTATATGFWIFSVGTLRGS